MALPFGAVSGIDRLDKQPVWWEPGIRSADAKRTFESPNHRNRSGLHSGDDDVHLDNVILRSANAGVPEPASVLMFLGGLSLVLAKLRKRS